MSSTHIQEQWNEQELTRPVRVPNDPQRLPTRLLRTPPQDPHKRRIQRPSRPILRHQPLRRRFIRCPRRSSRLPLLPRKDAVTILLALLTRRHTTQLPKRRRWHATNIQRRRHQGPVQRCRTSHGTHRFRQLRTTSHVLLRKETVSETSGYGRGHAAAHCE